MADADPARELDDLRASARERGLALVLLRHDEPDGAVTLEPLFLGAERQSDGLIALRILDQDDMRLELLADEKDLRLALDEPVGG